MCSRYHVNDDMIDALVEATDIVHQKGLNCSGDIFPSDNAPIIDGSTSKLRLETMKWGFQKPDRSGLLINARAETAAQKPTFRESLLRRRCVIPASYFYEWDKAKRKAAFSSFDSPLLCFAGVYRVDSDGPRFVILTREANESVRPVHDRMPLILGHEQISEWIYDNRQTQTILRQRMPSMAMQIEKKEQKTSELYLFPEFE